MKFVVWYGDCYDSISMKFDTYKKAIKFYNEIKLKEEFARPSCVSLSILIKSDKCKNIVPYDIAKKIK